MKKISVVENVCIFLQIQLIFDQSIENQLNQSKISCRYKVQWYKASLHTQKLILFLLQRGNKNFTLGVGGLFIGSLDCFASVRKYNILY